MRFTCCLLVAAFFATSLKASDFDEQPKKLNDQELKNLIAFANLYGYVRYFHPSDEALAIDWDKFAVNGIKEVEAAEDSTELMASLQKLFIPVAPSMKISWISKSDLVAEKLEKEISNSKRGKIRYWWYKGYGDSGFGWLMRMINVYRSGTKTVKVKNLENLKIKVNAPTQPFTAHITDEIDIIMPVSLYVRGGKTFPRTGFKKDKKTKAVYPTTDRSTRLGIVISSWSFLKLFYPYWEVTKTDWNQSLVNALHKCSADTNAKDFRETMDWLIADLHDGHGRCGSIEKSQGKILEGSLPMTIDWIEDEAVITSCKNCDSLGVAVGDIIKTFNGKEMKVLIDKEGKRISSGNETLSRKIAALFFFYGELDSAITMKLENAEGKTYEKTFSRVKNTELDLIPHEKMTKTEDGIFYLNFAKLSRRDFKKLLPQLAKAKGIVFDMRCYPNMGPGFLSHLSTSKLKSAKWMIPVLTYPETIPTQFESAGRWNLKPKTPYLSCPKVFITNEIVVSYAESVMGIVEAYKMGEIVGSPTAGTNGNMNYVEFLNSYGVMFTGMKVLKNDGSQHHGVGILPTVPCSKTIQGIREGKDEQLDKAMEVLKAQIKAQN